MSFTLIEQATSRLHRSELAVPGSAPGMFEKAAASKADVVFLDLEDAVAPDDKEQARKNIIQGLNDINWGKKTMTLRINGLDTHYCYRDVVDVLENCPRLDVVLIPKVGVPADVYAIDMMITQIEQYKKRTKKIGIEDADRDRARHGQCRGHRAVVEAAGGHVLRRRRLRRLDPRPHDRHRRRERRITACCRTRTRTASATIIWADQWHAAQTRMMVACRAYGLRPIDGPFGDFGDPDGFIAAAKRAAVLGYEGKWAIHPSQIELANQVFTPSEAEVTKARRILEAMAQAAKEGKGAVSLDGRLIDIASIRMAEALIEKANAMAGA